MENASILIAEDDTIMAMDLKSRLTRLGYAVPAIVSSGSEAIQKAGELRPDLVLMDIVLKGEMDGIEAAKHIRDRFDLPVVFLTAYSDEKTLQQARTTEPYGYLLKPFENRELYSTIEIAIYKHRMEKKLKESERWLSTTLKSIGDALIAIDTARHVKMMNPAAEALTGWRQDEAVGCDVFDVFNVRDEETGNRAESPIETALGHGETPPLAHHVLAARGGKTIPIEDSVAPIRDERGSISGAVVVFRNITERKRAEEALRESEERFRTMVDTAPVTLWMSGTDALCTFFNRPWLEFTGRSAEQELGTGWTEGIHPDDYRRRLDIYQTAFDQRRSFEMEYRLRRADGEYRWVLDRGVPRFLPDGSFAGYIGSCIDITERRRAEEAGREQRALAEALRDTAAALNSTLNLDEVLDRILTLVGRVVPHDAASIMLAESGVAYTARRHGYTEPGLEADVLSLRLTVADVPSLRLMSATGRSLIIADTWADPNWVHMRETNWIRSYAGAPIRLKGRAVGFLNLVAATPDFFVPAHADRLQAFADQAAVAIENARLFASERLRRQEIEAVQQASLSLTSSLELLQVLDAILSAVFALVPLQDTHIFLYNGERLTFAAARTPEGRLTQPVVEPRPNGLTYSVARTGQPMVVEDVRQHPLPVGAPAGRQGAIIGLPLILGSTVVGVMNVYFPAPRHFAETELNALGLLASHAAIAIQNAQLFEAVRRSNEELERRVAERTAELEGERNRIRTILDSAGEGIYLTDPAGVIYYVNPANERMTGYAFAEALGQTPDLWRSGLTLPSVIEGMERYLQHGEGWEGEVIFRRKDGTLYDAALIVTPVHDGGGQLVGFVGVQRDITRFKELDRLKDQFVTRIGHEMRTPLANVVLNLDLLEHGRPDKREKYMEILHSEAARLRKLVDEFLEIAELDVAKDPIHLVPTNLNHLASSLIAGHRTLAIKRGLALGDHLDPHLPLAEVDPSLVDRAISLVLENALNYTPRGGRITVMTGSLQQEERDWVTISVQDTGPGILPEEMPHIFERFYRGRVASDYTIPGSGLGLAICKAIVDKLGGRITVDSQPGRGAAFTLWLRPALNLNS